MVAECNYGGRVTDFFDRRLINILIKAFYNDRILQEDFKFSPSGIYCAPKDGPLESYKEYIRNLPSFDRPEIFGLHDNAEITGALSNSNNLCATVLNLLPRVVSGAGKGTSQENIVKEKC